MYSMKADAGINSLQVGYDSSVWWGNNNPYLRNIGSSRGSYAGLLLSGWDNRFPPKPFPSLCVHLMRF